MLTSPYPIPPVLPSGHPRVMANAADLPRVRQNLADPALAEATRLWRQLCATPVMGIGATPEHGSYNLLDCLALEAQATEQLIAPSPAGRRAVIDTLLRLLEGFTMVGCYMDARWGGHVIFTAAEVYDWCYPALTAAERTAIIDRCEAIAEAAFEMGYPPARQTAISGHGSEAQLLRDLLAFAIAVYDERPDIYAFCAGRIFAEYVPAYNTIFAAGMSPQGPSYSAYRYTSMLWSALLMRPLGISALYDTVLPMAEGFCRLRRPDGEALRLGDDFYETKSLHCRRHPFAVPLFLAAALSGRKDLLAAADGWEGYLLPERYGLDYYIDGAWGEGLISPVSALIFANAAPACTAPAPAPGHYFGSPIGASVWRDERRMVFLKIGELWGSNHDHLDTGCFQLYCDGILASDSGVYYSYGAKHRRHFITRTASHSCLTVEIPGEPLFGEFKADAPYDGGTRRPCDGREPATLEGWYRDYRMAAVLEHRESPDELYLCGDLSPAYVHACTRVVRRMRFAPNEGAFGRLTVTDEVESRDPAYRKTFHLRCPYAPTVEGNTVTLRNPAGTALVCRVIEPQGAVIEAIGGEGRQFICGGRNYPPAEDHPAELGWGEVRISPAAAAIFDRFVVEMEFVPAKST
ncbi:MAG: heparinase II/III family protein [Clostridia bacterium]|nr:heparinase II/III family protein [Clostridia bacterium]